MAEQKMAKKNLKRRRLNGTHRWSDEETLNLVQEVAEEVKDKPESFEKPTAQIFYKKICGKSAALKTIDWVPMKNKMRHLKSTYMSALNWKYQTGAGLLASGDEKSVEEYIAKICPKWNHLEQIFGQRRGVNPSLIIETSMESEYIGNGIEQNNFLGFNSEDIGFEILEDTTISSPEPSPNSQSSIDSTPLKETMKKFQQSTPKAKNANPFCLLLSLQEKKLDIEVKRFELEKEVAESEKELKKIQLEQDFEIRKRQVESKERIKKYEIEIKYKSATE